MRSLRASVSVRPTMDASDELLATVNRAYRCPPGTERAWTFEGHHVVGDRITRAALMKQWEEGAFTLAAYDERDKLVGSVTVTREDEEGAVSIGMLNVDPSVQGQGVGARLLEAAEAAAGGGTMARLWMLARRAELKAFYERRGYREVPGATLPFPRGQGCGEPRPEAEQEYGGNVHFVLLEKRLP